MPIPRELRHLYRTPGFLEAKKQVRLRSGNHCEECQKPNGAKIRTRTGGGRMIWRPVKSITWRNEHGWPVRQDEMHEILDKVGAIRDITVQLHCSHLNHKAGDDRLENLRDLCQWHHVQADRPVQKVHAKETRKVNKDAKRELVPLLFPEASA